MFTQLFLLSDKWTLLLHISVGAERPFLNVVKKSLQLSHMKIVPGSGQVIVNPGSSHVCFLGSMCNSLTHSGKGSFSSRIDLPGRKPVPLLLLITWEICRKEPVFRRGGWHQHGNAITTEEFNKLPELSWSKLVFPLVSHQAHVYKEPYHVQGQNPVPLAAAGDLACWVLWVKHKWHSYMEK